MINAIEPGTVLPIHHHRESSETVVMLRGKGRWNYFDDQGNLIGSFLLSAATSDASPSRKARSTTTKASKPAR